MLFLLALAALIALLTFVIPWFLPTPASLREQDRVIAITRHGLTVAATVAGVGFLLGSSLWDVGDWPGSYNGMRGSLLWAALCFGFAGSRFFRRKLGSNPDSWT